MNAKATTIRLAGGMNIFVPQKVAKILDTPEMQRLRGLAQLGLAQYVYPSATHSRFSHALGVYHMATRYAHSLRNNSSYFRDKYSEQHLELLSLKALLHDIGHYPFAHYLEELWPKETGAPLQVHHSQFTRRIIDGKLRSPPQGRARHLTEVLESKFKIDPETLLDDSDSILSSILNGPIDCDKLDYLIRDGQACGVPYANSIDVDRLLASLVCYRRHDGAKDPGIAVTAKGISAVETVLTSRYQLFSEVYWHKTCRAIVGMIKEAFWLLVRARKLDQGLFNKIAMSTDDLSFLKAIGDRLAAIKKKAADDLILNALLSPTRRIYRRVITFSEIWDQKAYQALYPGLGGDYESAWRAKTKLVNRLNKMGSRHGTKHWRKLSPHHVLLDVPPADKDKVGEVFVYYADDLRHRRWWSMDKCSTVVGAISPGFEKKAKRIRVFCHPDYISQVRSLKGYGNEIREALLEDRF